MKEIVYTLPNRYATKAQGADSMGQLGDALLP